MPGVSITKALIFDLSEGAFIFETLLYIIDPIPFT